MAKLWLLLIAMAVVAVTLTIGQYSRPGNNPQRDRYPSGGSGYDRDRYPSGSGSGYDRDRYPSGSGSGYDRDRYPNGGSGYDRDRYPSGTGSGYDRDRYPSGTGSGYDRDRYPGSGTGVRPVRRCAYQCTLRYCRNQCFYRCRPNDYCYDISGRKKPGDIEITKPLSNQKVPTFEYEPKKE